MLRWHPSIPFVQCFLFCALSLGNSDTLLFSRTLKCSIHEVCLVEHYNLVHLVGVLYITYFISHVSLACLLLVLTNSFFGWMWWQPLMKELGEMEKVNSQLSAAIEEVTREHREKAEVTFNSSTFQIRHSTWDCKLYSLWSLATYSIVVGVWEIINRSIILAH